MSEGPVSALISSPSSPHWDPRVIIFIVFICIIFFVLSSHSMLRRIFCPLNTRFQRPTLQGPNLEDPSLQVESQGLGLSIIQSLPVFQFAEKAIVDEEGGQPRPSSLECAICLGEFKEGEWLKYLAGCKHRFHQSCIDSWFKDHSNCPLCRAPVNAYDHLNVNDASSESCEVIVGSEIPETRPDQRGVGVVPTH